jgi:hypothetical protein
MIRVSTCQLVNGESLSSGLSNLECQSLPPPQSSRATKPAHPIHCIVSHRHGSQNGSLMNKHKVQIRWNMFSQVITLWYRVFFRKLIVTHLIREFLALRDYKVHWRVHERSHGTAFWARWTQFTPANSNILKYILILSYHLCIGFKSGISSWHFRI